jgi:hypothetical protein
MKLERLPPPVTITVVTATGSVIGDGLVGEFQRSDRQHLIGRRKLTDRSTAQMP